jgi:tetratricopeptide (TPR) repeat protein
LYRLDVAGVTASVGRALAGMGKHTEGLAMLKRAILVLEESYARDHSYADIPYWLGQDHIWSGEILAETGDMRGAIDEYRRGASSLERLMSGMVYANTRSDIAASYTKVGTALALTEDNLEASSFYLRALKIAEPLARANPPNVLALYAVADAYFGMGELAEKKANRPEACDWYHKSADAWRQIPNPGWTTPSGFSTRGPETVAKNLRGCMGFD